MSTDFWPSKFWFFGHFGPKINLHGLAIYRHEFPHQNTWSDRWCHCHCCRSHCSLTTCNSCRCRRGPRIRWSKSCSASAEISARLCCLCAVGGRATTESVGRNWNFNVNAQIFYLLLFIQSSGHPDTNQLCCKMESNQAEYFFKTEKIVEKINRKH